MQCLAFIDWLPVFCSVFNFNMCFLPFWVWCLMVLASSAPGFKFKVPNSLIHVFGICCLISVINVSIVSVCFSGVIWFWALPCVCVQVARPFLGSVTFSTRWRSWRPRTWRSGWRRSSSTSPTSSLSSIRLRSGWPAPPPSSQMVHGQAGRGQTTVHTYTLTSWASSTACRTTMRVKSVKSSAVEPYQFCSFFILPQIRIQRIQNF